METVGLEELRPGDQITITRPGLAHVTGRYIDSDYLPGKGWSVLLALPGRDQWIQTPNRTAIRH